MKTLRTLVLLILLSFSPATLWAEELKLPVEDLAPLIAVSYTHLTLPTIYSV